MAPPPPPELLEELVGEILLRIPPDEPANLLCASLVCKRWFHFLSAPSFRRRYCRYHRTPPLLGFVRNMFSSDHAPRFVSTVASPCAPPALDSRGWWALDGRHGRVLIHSFETTDLVVWDPLTGEQRRVPLPPYPHPSHAGVVLCDAAGCDHLDCHDGPFRVVFVGMDDDDNGSIWVSVYSSETSAWGACASCSIEFDSKIMSPSLHIGDALYFMVDHGDRILRYDLAGTSFSVIDVPGEYEEMGALVMVEDGRLGFAVMEDGSLYLWSWQEATGDGAAGWKQCRVIELATLLPLTDTSESLDIVGFVEGTDAIFLSTDVGIFTLEIKSGRVTKVGKEGVYSAVVPYTGFCLP